MRVRTGLTRPGWRSVRRLPGFPGRRGAGGAGPPGKPPVEEQAGAFGPRPGQVNDVTQAGWKRWVEQQLQPEAIDDSSLQEKLAKCCLSRAMSLTESSCSPKL